MLKARSRPRGKTTQVTTYTLNGVPYLTFQGVTTNYATREILELSQGHNYLAISGKRRKPRKPKPYRGSDPAKQAASVQHLVEYSRRLANYLDWKNADIGGPFQARSIIPWPARRKIVDSQNFGSGYVAYCKGTYASNGVGFGNTITLNPSSNSELDAYGTQCIARCLPTNPLSNMGQFLYELKDLPQLFNPGSWKERTGEIRRLANSASGEYLNVAFGWLPMLEDIWSFLKVTSNFQKHINQYARDSGRHIRRQAKLFDRSTTVSSIVGTPGNAGPWPTPSFIQQGGTCTKDVTTKQRVWFKGSFTYYLPPLDGSATSFFKRYGAFANKLYGLRISPDLLWRIAPWSWAYDWIGNAGPIIRNWDAFHNQGLVMHYGYIMEEKIETTKYSLDGFRLLTDKTKSIIDYTFQTSKVRRKATPYGFGLNPASFSPFQQGIIAALGINHASRWL